VRGGEGDERGATGQVSRSLGVLRGLEKLARWRSFCPSVALERSTGINYRTRLRRRRRRPTCVSLSLSVAVLSVPRCSRAQSISTSFSTNHQIHLVSVSKTTPVAPRRCPSTAGSPKPYLDFPLPPPLPLAPTCRRVSLHAQVHRMMRLNLRSVRPNAVFSSFLGLLDIKLGECGSSS
jgi:hypothetical protein